MAILITLLFIAGIFWWSSKKTTSIRKDYLQQTLMELEKLSETEKDKSIRSLILRYKKELNSLTYNLPQANTSASTQMVRPISQIPQKSMQQDISEGWDNWYSENSINLLLYVGAFLIVASASIFVGFQWGSIAGILKVFMISGVTLAFTILGLIFYRSPKIKQAGMVFTSIGALLIPICGIAFYKFVFEPVGISGGTVWLMTSGIMLLFYIYLITYFNRSFFTYLSSIAAASVALSVVNMFHLNHTYYVLGGIISAFMILFTRLLIKTETKNELVVSKPLELSSNIIMLLSVIFGFVQGAVEDKLFTFEGTICALLVTVYFAVSYLRYKLSWQFALSALFLPLAIFFFLQWHNVSKLVVIYTFEVVTLMYMCFISYYKKQNKLDELASLQFIAVFLSIVTYMSGLTTSVGHKVITTLLFGAEFYLLYYITQASIFIAGGTLSIAFITYLFVKDFLHVQDSSLMVSMIYAFFGVAHYVLTVYSKKKKELSYIFGISAGVFFILSIIFSFDYGLWVAGIFLILTVVFLSASYRFSKLDLIYVSNLFLYLALYSLIIFFKVPVEYRPLIYTALSFVLYAVSFQISPALRDKYQSSAYLAQGLLFITFFFQYGLSESYSARTIINERYALITSYASLALFTLHAVVKRSTLLGYVASGAALLLYFWQINYLGITAVQAYTLVAALYFMGLAYTRKMQGDEYNRLLLDITGLAIMLMPTLVQSFRHNGTSYSLLMGAEGILLLIVGISWAYSLYKYAGIAAITLAVISQTYVYILNIPRWLLTGCVGIVFLIVAIYLLLKRKEK